MTRKRRKFQKVSNNSKPRLTGSNLVKMLSITPLFKEARY